MPLAPALPTELTIYAVAGCRETFLAELDRLDADDTPEAPLQLPAQAVEEVDAAGLQLLIALERSLARRGRRLQLQAPSPTFAAACRRLGLHDWVDAVSLAPPTETQP